MIEQRWLLFLLGWALAAALQAVLYLRQRQTRDATLVDAGWAVLARAARRPVRACWLPARSSTACSSPSS